MMYWVLWTAVVTAAPRLALAACGGTYSGIGNITSPNYPDNYPDNQACNYTVLADDGAHLVMFCPIINIQRSRGCTKDYLEIDGHRYCGRTSFRKTAEEQLTVRFVSDASVSRSGFVCRYGPITGVKNVENKDVATRGITCNNIIQKDSTWRGGWDGDVEIPVTTLTKSWKVDIGFSSPITSFQQWTGGTTTKHSDNWYSVSKNNAYIKAGEKISFHFLCRYDASKGEPVVNRVQLDGIDVCGAGAESGCRAPEYDYDEVLHKSLLFYEAQRSGKLPANNRIPWRGDSALDDAIDHDTNQRVDLQGGYYDAGDYVKFGYPMASTATILAWGAVEYRQVYTAAGEMANMEGAVRWATDYFLKAHKAPHVLYGQVGDAKLDHKEWGRPEDMAMARPAFKITEQRPGSDLAGETAAALAAASVLFQSTDNSYSKKCLTHAKQLYDFANSFRGKYSESIPAAAANYKSYGVYYDELAWAAVWLYRATGDRRYLSDAETHYSKLWPNSVMELSWAEKTPGVQVLLSQLADSSDKPKYRQDLQGFCDRSLAYRKTPKGLLYIGPWGALRYAANTAYVCLRAADLGIKPDQYRQFARQQIHYMLGSTGRSFVVGFGKNPPQHPHHRSSSCGNPPQPCDWSDFNSPDPNPHVLFGALVGGPDQYDNYKDDRGDYVKNEVACDYNAGFQSAVAALRSLTDCARSDVLDP